MPKVDAIFFGQLPVEIQPPLKPGWPWLSLLLNIFWIRWSNKFPKKWKPSTALIRHKNNQRSENVPNLLFGGRARFQWKAISLTNGASLFLYLPLTVTSKVCKLWLMGTRCSNSEWKASAGQIWGYNGITADSFSFKKLSKPFFLLHSTFLRMGMILT